jgi:GNAT superfamily N-acetyltransferase
LQPTDPAINTVICNVFARQIIHLRKAIFTEDGRDKDVTAGIASPFLKYDRNGLDVEISFSAKLTKDEADWAFDVVQANMEEIYDASGYGWDDEDKMKELTEGGARFLLVRERAEPGDDCPGPLVAFAHFRFSVQGEVMDQMEGETMLYVWDIHVDDDCQRKGLGRHLLTVMELIARREQMKMIALPVQLSDVRTLTWINSKCKGYAPDKSLLNLVGFDAEMEGFEVYAKHLDLPKPAAAAPALAVSVPAAVATPAKKAGVSVEVSSPHGVSDAVLSPVASPVLPLPSAGSSSSGSSGSSSSEADGAVVVPSIEVWQTLTARPASPRKSSSSSIDSTAAAAAVVTVTASAPIPAAAAAAAAAMPEAVPEAAETDADAEPTFVEQDILATIKRMYREQHPGREPTAAEEREWLKQIRETEAEEDGVAEAKGATA